MVVAPSPAATEVSGTALAADRVVGAGTVLAEMAQPAAAKSVPARTARSAAARQTMAAAAPPALTAPMTGVTDRFGAYNPERNPTNFGPVLRPIVWAVNELQYQLLGLKPLANAAPLGSRGPVLIGAVAPFGNPVSFAVSAAPARGAVSAAGGGLFFYTPDEAFVAAGGVDSFTVEVTDGGFHLGTLFGLPGHRATVTVPISLPQPVVPSPGGAEDTVAFSILNTGINATYVSGYENNNASLSPVLGTGLTSPATGADVEVTQTLFEIGSSQSVTVGFNPAGVTHQGTVASTNVGSGPAFVAMTPNGDRAYVTNSSSNSVSVIDTDPNSATFNDVMATIAVAANPFTVAVSPDGKRTYVVAVGNNSVSVIDADPSSASYNTVTATIAVGVNPMGVAVTPDSKKVYVTNWGESVSGVDKYSTVMVIDADPDNATYNTVIATLTSINYPIGVAVSPDGTKFYVTGSNATTGYGELSVIDTTSNAVSSTINLKTVSSTAVRFNPDGTRAYVLNSFQPSPTGGFGTVSVIDTATNSVIASIGVDNTPIGMAVSPDGKYVYVTNSGFSNTTNVPGNSVSVIDAVTNQVTATLDAGNNPYGVAVSPINGLLYVVATGNNAVSVIDPNGTDGGQFQYTVTMTGSSATCTAKGSDACQVIGTSIYLEDPPGTVFLVATDEVQQQSDILQNLVADDLSNAIFVTKSEPSIGYTDPTIPIGFSPYYNGTKDNSTNTYTVTSTTSTATSTTYNVSVKVTEEAKLFNMSLRAEEGAQATWGTTVTDTNTYTQTLQQIVEPGDRLYIYWEMPVYRFYGDWNVTYGNTEYIMQDVWYNTPYKVGVYPAYLAAYTCTAANGGCDGLEAIPPVLPNTDAFPTGFPSYPITYTDDSTVVGPSTVTGRESQNYALSFPPPRTFT